MGFYESGEAFRTQILNFDTNTAHSNKDTGFFFGDELQEDQDFSGHFRPGETNKCDPRENPLDPESPVVVNLGKAISSFLSNLHLKIFKTFSVKSLTAFKNKEQNTWTDCRHTTYDNYKSSDAKLGYTQRHDCDVINSMFIGESGRL